MTSLLALKNGQPVAVRKLLGANSWIGLAYLANASSAGPVFASFDRLGLVVVLAAVPLVAVFLVTIRARFQALPVNPTEEKGMTGIPR